MQIPGSVTDFRPKLAEHLRYWECAVAARQCSDDAGRRRIWSFWTGPDPLMHPKPQCGYWKVRWTIAGLRVWRPAAIWMQDGVLVGSVGTQQQVDLDRLWQRCGAEPVSYETYRYAYENGHFPGEIDAAQPKLDNLADDPGAKLRDDIASLLGSIELYIRKCGEPLSEDAANSLANYLDMIRLAEKTAGETLKTEIEAQKAEIARRRELWGVTIEGAAEMASRLRDLLTPFLRGKKAAGQDAKIGGQAGKRLGLRSVWKARVLDWPKVMQEYQNDPRVRDFVQKLLDANARSKDRNGIPIEGAEYFEEEFAG